MALASFPVLKFWLEQTTARVKQNIDPLNGLQILSICIFVFRVFYIKLTHLFEKETAANP